MHTLHLNPSFLSVAFAAATLAAAALTRNDPERSGIPIIDGRYWFAMLLAGMFGTICGDLASHQLHVFGAAGLLLICLVLAIIARNAFASLSMIAYWVVVLVERCAGTPIGDGLASKHGVGLGLPLAMLCTGGVFLALLAVQKWVSTK